MPIDAHVHLASPPLIENREKYLRGEEGLAALYASPKAKMVGTAELLQNMAAEGVDRALVMGFPFQKEENAQSYNDWLLEECARYPDKLLPLCAFDPRAPFAEKLAADFLERGGFGLGELCVYDSPLSPPLIARLRALSLICRNYDAPILVHVNEPLGHSYPGKAPIAPQEILELVRETEGVKLILAHFGGGLPFWASLKKGVREHLARVRFDLAATPFIYSPSALKAGIAILGPEYFLLGTDFPLLGYSRYLRFFQDAGLSPAEIGVIVEDNPRSFLGIT
ncbi:MAG: amidohydrolase family protein [Deltaproteobacteria bacterium]|jgi:predicted TIM-barrel fold metal-dependent hydrolase|nr:amidohydrolase family protein [Deltaproteobacteria bacterium]